MALNTTAAGLSLTPVLPLIPLAPASLGWLDLVLPPLLFGLSLLWYDLSHPASRTDSDAPLAHVFTNKTSHARFLPVQAKHRFTYPVLQVGFDLDALEAGDLDLPWLFRFLRRPGKDESDGGKRRWAPWNWFSGAWTVCSLRPGAYLRPIRPGQTSSTDAGAREPYSIKAPLLAELQARHGVDTSSIGRCYLVTMPRFLGYEGINPLSVHFCYSASASADGPRGGLKVVVLEVHNTFGERSLYVLRPGVDEEPHVQAGYEHQWLFPRSFHVSPFNDRSGSYRVCLSDPFPPSSSPATPYSATPRFRLKIVLLTESGQKKLYASLSGSGVPFTPSSLFQALLRFPLGLVLPLPRILWQATKLHFRKRLDVFPRPEPYFVPTDQKDSEANVVVDPNPVRKGAKVGGVGWQTADWTTNVARRRVLAFLRRRVSRLAEAGTAIEVELVSGDTNVSPIVIRHDHPTVASPSETRMLSITYLTPLFFNDLVGFPSPDIALLVGSKTEGRWHVNSEDLFKSVFDSPRRDARQRRKSRIEQVRASQLRWHLAFLDPSSPSPTLATEVGNPLDDIEEGASQTQLLFAVLFTSVAERLAYHIFAWTGARFVKGTEPWGQVARAVGPRISDRQDDIGSVLRELIRN